MYGSGGGGAAGVADSGGGDAAAHVTNGGGGDGCAEYDGEWLAGRMHGHGTCVWASGERYDGTWRVGNYFQLLWYLTISVRVSSWLGSLECSTRHPSLVADACVGRAGASRGRWAWGKSPKQAVGEGEDLDAYENRSPKGQVGIER